MASTERLLMPAFYDPNGLYTKTRGLTTRGANAPDLVTLRRFASGGSDPRFQTPPTPDPWGGTLRQNTINRGVGVPIGRLPGFDEAKAAANRGIYPDPADDPRYQTPPTIPPITPRPAGKDVPPQMPSLRWRFGPLDPAIDAADDPRYQTPPTIPPITPRGSGPPHYDPPRYDLPVPSRPPHYDPPRYDLPVPAGPPGGPWWNKHIQDYRIDRGIYADPADDPRYQTPPTIPPITPRPLPKDAMWPDASRGLRKPGMGYAQVLTPVNPNDPAEVARWWATHSTPPQGIDIGRLPGFEEDKAAANRGIVPGPIGVPIGRLDYYTGQRGGLGRLGDDSSRAPDVGFQGAPLNLGPGPDPADDPRYQTPPTIPPIVPRPAGKEPVGYQHDPAGPRYVTSDPSGQPHAMGTWGTWPDGTRVMTYADGWAQDNRGNWYDPNHALQVQGNGTFAQPGPAQWPVNPSAAGTPGRVSLRSYAASLRPRGAVSAEVMPATTSGRVSLRDFAGQDTAPNAPVMSLPMPTPPRPPAPPAEPARPDRTFPDLSGISQALGAIGQVVGPAAQFDPVLGDVASGAGLAGNLARILTAVGDESRGTPSRVGEGVAGAAGALANPLLREGIAQVAPGVAQNLAALNTPIPGTGIPIAQAVLTGINSAANASRELDAPNRSTGESIAAALIANEIGNAGGMASYLMGPVGSFMPPNVFPDIAQGLIRLAGLAPGLSHSQRERLETDRELGGVSGMLREVNLATTPAELNAALQRYAQGGPGLVRSIVAGTEGRETFPDAAALLANPERYEAVINAGVEPGNLEDATRAITEAVRQSAALMALAQQGHPGAQAELAARKAAREDFLAKSGAFLNLPDRIQLPDGSYGWTGPLHGPSGLADPNEIFSGLRNPAEGGGTNRYLTEAFGPHVVNDYLYQLPGSLYREASVPDIREALMNLMGERNGGGWSQITGDLPTAQQIRDEIAAADNRLAQRIATLSGG